MPNYYKIQYAPNDLRTSVDCSVGSFYSPSQSPRSFGSKKLKKKLKKSKKKSKKFLKQQVLKYRRVPLKHSKSFGRRKFGSNTLSPRMRKLGYSDISGILLGPSAFQWQNSPLQRALNA